MTSAGVNTESLAASPAAADGQVSAHRPEAADTYRQILKSSALIGTSSLVGIVFGILRTKAMALMLGPASFGLLGAYSSIVDLGRTISQLGINASGVRQIAQAVATGDDDRIAATALTLQRVAIGTALLGALVLLGFSKLVTEFTFGSLLQWKDVALLSLAIFFGVLAGGQTALIQGMRRISDLSQLSMIAALLGTIASIGLVYFFREDGLAIALIVGAACSALAGWLYSRRIKLPRVATPLSVSTVQAAALFKLGTAFMVGELLVQGSAYLVRIIILRDSGLAAAGLYQAAWTLGGLYVGFVLQSMAADFYPRLAACISDKPAANRLVNEQATVSLLLAGPGVVATLTLAPLVVHLLYSSKFDGSIETLRWICFGMALRTISWPMGFIIAAAGRQTIFIAAELAWTLVNIALTFVLVEKMGPAGAGVAFFLSYIFHVVMLLPLVRHLTGFRWTKPNLQLGSAYVVCCSIVLAASYILPSNYVVALGIVVTLSLTLYSAYRLVEMSASGPMPRLVTKLVNCARWFRQSPRAVKATQ